jgi:hypothetical protein
MSHSFYDTDQKLWVDCTECKRGHRGEKNCSAGWKHKKGGVFGCFSGELIEGIEVRA